MKRIINPKFKPVFTTEVDQRPDQVFTGIDDVLFQMWLEGIKDFIVLLFLYTTIFYKYPFDTTPYLINAVLKNSMVLNMKVYNLKHIYFPGLGRRLV